MSNWKDRSVLVTGATGFLGSHLARTLVDCGAKVVCLVRGDRPSSLFRFDGTADRVERVHGSVSDLPLLVEVLRKRQVTDLFHLAAQPIVVDAKADPFATMESNVRGTYAVLEAARRYGGLKSIIASTSDKVYDSAIGRPPHREDHPLGGMLPYEASKVCADVLCRSYAKSYGLPIGVARMGNLYGPGDLQWSRIVPGTIRSLLRGERPVIRGDGKALRDYFYVEDAAEALLLFGAALLDREDVRGEALNFGTGTATSVIDLVSQLAERTEGDLRPVVLGEARDEILAQWLDCMKAKRMLGWEPSTCLSDGLDRAWNWYKKAFS